jgi:5-methylcytosine-specific restriction endonuclease McrBC regulatory subunit McrC
MSSARRQREVDQASEIGLRVEASRESKGRLITLMESGAASLPLDSDQLSVFLAQPAERLDRLQLTLFAAPVSDAFVPRIQPGVLIGSGRFVYGSKHIDVVIEPKVGHANFFKMLETIHGGVTSLNHDSTAYLSHGAISEYLVWYVLYEIERFLEAPVNRDYFVFEDSGTRNPRGRLHLKGYATTSLPRLKYDVMPCSYFRYSVDILENQVLRAAVEVIGRLLASVSANAREKLSELFLKVKSNLIGVSNTKITAAVLDQIEYQAKNFRYKHIHNICRLIVEGSTVSLVPGRNVSFMAFSLNMSDLYERYIRAILTKAFGSRLFLSKSRIAYSVGGKANRVRLDGLVDLGDRRIVVECKYKLIENYGFEFIKSAVSPSDIYQAVAYCVHDEVNADECCIVYPTLDANGPPLRQIDEVSDFSRGNGKPLRIRIFLVNLNKQSDELKQAFRTMLGADLVLAP